MHPSVSPPTNVPGRTRMQNGYYGLNPSCSGIPHIHDFVFWSLFGDQLQDGIEQVRIWKSNFDRRRIALCADREINSFLCDEIAVDFWCSLER